jgi:thymidylate synthase (FAD)
MELIKQSAELIDPMPEWEVLEKLERIGRVCYKSEDRITEDSASKFIKMLLTNNHLSVLEHINITFHIVTDRGVSHELVRHRHFSFAQESTRYVSYDDKMQYVEPAELHHNEHDERFAWGMGCMAAEKYYKKMREMGGTAQQSRALLNNANKTELYMTGNIRSWLEILPKRLSKSAHPQMRALMTDIAYLLEATYPNIFRRETDDKE